MESSTTSMVELYLGLHDLVHMILNKLEKMDIHGGFYEHYLISYFRHLA